MNFRHNKHSFHDLSVLAAKKIHIFYCLVKSLAKNQKLSSVEDDATSSLDRVVIKKTCFTRIWITDVKKKFIFWVSEGE